MKTTNPLKTKGFFVLFVLFLLGGCGLFVDDAPPEEEGTFGVEGLLSGCEINPERLSRFFDERISNEIRCLQQGFNDFRYVRRIDPSNISRDDLRIFVNDFFNDTADTIINDLDIIFKVNSLFLDTPDAVISIDDIEKLFDILYSGNITIAEIRENSRRYERGEIGIDEFRETFIMRLSSLSEVILANMSLRENSSASISTLVSDILDRLRFHNVDSSYLERVLFRVQVAKKLVVGGERNTIKTEEIRTLMGKIPFLAGILFDILYFQEFKLETDSEQIIFLGERIKTALSMVEQQEGILFYIDELEDLFPEQMGRWTSLEVIKIVESNKESLLNEENNSYTYRNIKQSENFLALSLETFKFYEHSVALLSGIREKTAEREHIDRLRNQGEVWRKNIEALLDPTLYPDEIKIGDFIEHSWQNLHFTYLGSRQFLAVVATKIYFLPHSSMGILKKNEMSTIATNAPFIVPLIMTALFDTNVERNINRRYFSYLETFRALRKHFYRGEDIFVRASNLSALAPLLGDNAGIIDIIITKPDLDPGSTIKPISFFAAVKRRFIIGDKSNDEEVLTFSEFDALLDIVDKVLVDIALSTHTFDLNREILENKKKITYTLDLHPFLATPLFSGPPLIQDDEVYSSFTELELREFLREFVYIVEKYKYFRDERGFQIYDNKYHRHKEGLIEIVFLRNLCKILIESYSDDDLGEQKLPVESIELFLNEFKSLLSVAGLWTEHYGTFPRNVVLLSDLFQQSSNGDFHMGLDEAVEFIGLVVTSSRIRNVFLERMDPSCFLNDGTERLKLGCYRQHFFDAFFPEQMPFGDYVDFRSYFPKLNAYVDSLTHPEVTEFVKQVEVFSRGENEDPMTGRDITILIGALLNVESTLIRYDQYEDNNLDEQELWMAFPTYKRVIAGITDISESEERLLESAFFYVVKNKGPPEGLLGPVKFLGFHANFQRNPWRENIMASRINIAAILYTIAISNINMENE